MNLSEASAWPAHLGVGEAYEQIRAEHWRGLLPEVVPYRAKELQIIPRAPQPEPVAEPRPPVRCALYRHYDADGVLLYIGISDQPGVRQTNHAATSVWVEFADHFTGVWFPSRESAAAAEVEAIQTEVPVFNIASAPPGREWRVRTYLVSKGRSDLYASIQSAPTNIHEEIMYVDPR